MYEDTANFATANQTMQVYKAGVLKRYRTWLQGILEDYWYDTILADHLGMEVKDVLSSPIKIKAIFQDINFETRKEIIEADKILFDMDVVNRADIAKDIDRKDLVTRIESEESKMDEEQKAAVNDTFMNQRNELQQKNAQLQLLQAQAVKSQQQQASAAASVKIQEKEKENKELEIMNARVKVLDTIKSAVEKVNAQQQQSNNE